MDRAKAALVEVGRNIFDHPEAEVFERGNSIGQRDRAAALIELEPQLARIDRICAAQPRAPAWSLFTVIRQAAQARYIDCGFDRAIGAAVSRGEGIGKARRDRSGARRIFAGGDFGFDRIGPAAQHGLQLQIELGLIGRGNPVADIEHKADQRQIAAFDLQAPIKHRGLRRVAQHRGNGMAHIGGQRIARQPHEREQVSFKRGLHQGQARARAIDQAHHRHGNPFQIGV